MCIRGLSTVAYDLIKDVAQYCNFIQECVNEMTMILNNFETIHPPNSIFKFTPIRSCVNWSYHKIPGCHHTPVKNCLEARAIVMFGLHGVGSNICMDVSVFSPHNEHTSRTYYINVVRSHDVFPVTILQSHIELLHVCMLASVHVRRLPCLRGILICLSFTGIGRWCNKQNWQYCLFC